AAWPMARDAVQTVLDDPARADTPYQSSFGPSTFASVVDRFYAFDLVVHAWDIARAAGLPDLEPMPAEEIAPGSADPEGLGDAQRRPGVCGPPVPVPDGADAQSRLLGFLGRQP
ncbi:MAG: TIGR03086 family protein, partial [Pseudonocardia sediminis]